MGSSFRRRLFLALFVGLLVALGQTGGAEAVVPGQNGKIAFTSVRDGNAEIYAMNPDGSDQTNITENPASDSSPAFSPDGRRIAFVSDRDGNLEIYAMNVDGSGVTRLTSNASGDFAPAFSPDGHRIAFVSDRDGNSEIYTMNVDGSGVTRLTHQARPDLEPTFSPDGQRIAFVREGPTPPGSMNDRTPLEIFTMAPDGSDLRRLTNETLDARPNFSPDGQRIAFSRNLFRHHKIFTMATDGSDQTSITDNIPGNCGRFVDDLDPVFSPDGKWIAFGSNREDVAGPCPSSTFSIFLMAPDGSGVTRLATDAGDPDWQPLPSPANKEACKHGGWKKLGFKNQGQCIKAARHAS